MPAAHGNRKGSAGIPPPDRSPVSSETEAEKGPETLSDADDIPAEASLVIEALASMSKEVYTAYYDVSLKGNAARDEESLEMLEIIFDTRVLDLGRTMWQELFVEKMARPMFENNDRNMSSLLTSFESMALEEMKRINESGQ